MYEALPIHRDLDDALKTAMVAIDDLDGTQGTYENCDKALELVVSLIATKKEIEDTTKNQPMAELAYQRFDCIKSITTELDTLIPVLESNDTSEADLLQALRSIEKVLCSILDGAECGPKSDRAQQQDFIKFFRSIGEGAAIGEFWHQAIQKVQEWSTDLYNWRGYLELVLVHLRYIRAWCDDRLPS